jgi:hypothetical protein
MVGPHIHDGHSGSKNALDETALTSLVFVVEHSLPANVLAGEPPSDIWHEHGQRKSGNIPQPSQKHQATLLGYGGAHGYCRAKL